MAEESKDQELIDTAEQAVADITADDDEGSRQRGLRALAQVGAQAQERLGAEGFSTTPGSSATMTTDEVKHLVESEEEEAPAEGEEAPVP